MGEPATKEVLSLDELEAVAGQRTGRKHILSILVENKPGVLTRIAGLFARRGFNIDTLAVGPTDDERFSRITLTLDGAVHPIDQVGRRQQVGLTRARRGAAHVHPRDRAFARDHDGAARGPPRIGEMADLDPGDIGDRAGGAAARGTGRGQSRADHGKRLSMACPERAFGNPVAYAAADAAAILRHSCSQRRQASAHCWQ